MVKTSQMLTILATYPVKDSRNNHGSSWRLQPLSCCSGHSFPPALFRLSIVAASQAAPRKQLRAWTHALSLWDSKHHICFLLAGALSLSERTAVGAAGFLAFRSVSPVGSAARQGRSRGRDRPTNPLVHYPRRSPMHACAPRGHQHKPGRTDGVILLLPRPRPPQPQSAKACSPPSAFSCSPHASPRPRAVQLYCPAGSMRFARDKVLRTATI
jgi:hypothetical protein